MKRHTSLAGPVALFAAVLAILFACTQLGIAPASSLDQRIAYAYGVHTAVLNAATDALEHGEIQVDDARRVLKVADEAKAGLDAAKVAAGAGDISTAEGRLQLSISLLTKLQDYLRRPE